jgi:hypothetical protein
MLDATLEDASVSKVPLGLVGLLVGPPRHRFPNKLPSWERGTIHIHFASRSCFFLYILEILRLLFIRRFYIVSATLVLLTRLARVTFTAFPLPGFLDHLDTSLDWILNPPDTFAYIQLRLVNIKPKAYLLILYFFSKSASSLVSSSFCTSNF